MAVSVSAHDFLGFHRLAGLLRAMPEAAMTGLAGSTGGDTHS